jgi:hypothetical protein
MKENFKEQFENLRLIIRANVVTIRSLGHQSESLSNIISMLEANETEEKKQLRSQLELLRKQFSDSLNQLVSQTDDLFNTYKNLIEKVFGKQ